MRLRNEARFAELRNEAILSDQAQAHPKKERHSTAPSLLGWRKKDRKSLRKLAKDHDKRKKSIGKIREMIDFKPRMMHGYSLNMYMYMQSSYTNTCKHRLFA